MREILVNKSLILCSRWHASGVAYGVTRGFTKDFLMDLRKNTFEPDMHIYMKCSLDEVMRRIKANGREGRKDKEREKQPIFEAEYEKIIKDHNEKWKKRCGTVVERIEEGKVTPESYFSDVGGPIGEARKEESVANYVTGVSSEGGDGRSETNRALLSFLGPKKDSNSTVSVAKDEKGVTGEIVESKYRIPYTVVHAVPFLLP